ncbi:hypothetical protein [Dechloromonas sp. H13]|uniref:hypothetical protein n=1 Tax=Dechloromonas sp. H13 TaxID=2570193 RepID=UPI0012911A46|nr:hypothetical protein [Dechloromonas sp. H13]
MRLPLIIASLLYSLLYSSHGFAAPQKKPVNSRKMGLTIKVEGEGWGSVRKETIEAVLYSVADELMTRLPKKLNVPIVVTHTDSNPVALYERGADGEYRVELHARGANWHLYTYEFAHELCHILSNYEENAAPGNSRYNQWFEETLCETASLFTLKKLATTWKESPPAPADWSKEADKLNRFFDLLIAEGHRQLPPHSPLAVWLASNEERLRANPYQREKNELVANLLLPLFERNPENWSTLSYLNLDPGDARSSLQDYLRNWYRNAPDEHKTFIADVLDLFQMREVITAAIPAETTLVAVAATGPGAGRVAAQGAPEQR